MSASANPNAFSRPDGDGSGKSTAPGTARSARANVQPSAGSYPHELARRLICSLALLIAGALTVVLFR